MAQVSQFIHRLSLWISILGIVVSIGDIGFAQGSMVQQWMDGFYFIVFGLVAISIMLRYVENYRLFTRKVFIIDVVVLAFFGALYYIFPFGGDALDAYPVLKDPLWITLAVFVAFVREISELRINYKRAVLNPAQLFVVSFMLIILMGTLLLLLPKASHHGISVLDALFTSTSAVCVTGLIVVDTGSHFTLIGQVIIMLLIQLGGLGILTFASYFAYFFKGGTSYENHLALSDLTNARKLADVFSTLKFIIITTFGIELVAGVLIYFSTDYRDFASHFDHVFFATFHSVSAFCNAGFSTLSNSLYESEHRFNYPLQLVVALTFIFGGLGFHIVTNILAYIKYQIIRIFTFTKRKPGYRPWVLNLNSRLTLITTISVTVLAFFGFYFLEYNNTLEEHAGLGKVAVAFFGATTPRTAGFNSIDTSAMLFPTTMMVFLLMWIGASPASTGGGIKTSTFAIATLNILSLAKGKNRIEIFRREIADLSVRRAFAVISLSLIVIGTAILLISVFDSDKDLKNIAFECFSAYSTVGLSLGVTADLSAASKFVLIGVMFVGRVSMLTMVIAVFKKTKHKNYRYPKEEITIN